MEKPLISVIVPIYNVEKYLRKCIDSILLQTYDELEIILVDDGSTDESGLICDEYECKDERVRVIHKNNGGLSDARNIGLDECRGDFISFIDSDDFVSPFFIETLYKGFIEKEVDITLLTERVCFWDGEKEDSLFKGHSHYKKRQASVKNAMEYMLYQKIPTGVVSRLYRRHIFNDLRFPKGYLYEDMATSHKMFMNAKGVTMIDAGLYAYRMRKNSIIREDFSERKMIAITIAEQVFSDICKYDISLKKAAASRVFALCYSVFLQIPKENVEEKKKMWNTIKKYQWYVITDLNVNVRRKDRIAAFITFLGERVSYYVGRKYGQKGSMY